MLKKNYQELCGFICAQRAHIWWGLGLGLLAALLLGKYLVSDTLVLSREGTDTFSQFVYTYALGFDGLTQGRVTLWNPYVYGGQPFLGQFQTGMLYPVNWLLMWLPLALALNWLVFLHVWLIGAGVYGWAVWRGVRPLAAFAAGAALMLSGPFFIHIYAGHLPNLCSMAWAPFVFWGIDGWLKRRHIGWILLSASAAALQLYSGHPQYFYYTAIVSGLYALVFLFGAERKTSAVVGLLAIYPLTVMLAAAQLLPGLAATGESVRMGGAGREFAEMFALPWENFFTLLAPWFFGKLDAYWGKCYLWEMQLYCGIGTLMLGGLALARGARREKIQWGTLLVIVALLALGSQTPLYDLLYAALPGFDLFRGTSKFGFFLALFAALLAGHGLNSVLEGKPLARWAGFAGVGLAALMVIFGLSLQSGFSGWFAELLKNMTSSPESYAKAAFSSDASLSAAQAAAGGALLLAGLWLALFGALWLLVPRWRRAAWGFVALMVIDGAVFVWPSITGFELQKTKYQPIADMLKQNPGDYRTLNLFNPESNVGLRSEGLWGYDPFVLKRYAEFMFFTQGLNPDAANQNLQITKNTPLLSLVRGRAAFVPTDKGLTVQPLQEQALPRFFIVNKWRVMNSGGAQGRDAILRTLADPSFNPKQEVILEEDPLLPPDAGEAQYQIRLVNFSTDHWTLEVVTTRSSLLVMTDAFSKDWRVKELPGSVQTNYHVLPANHALRAIPLAPGRHVIKIECLPTGWRGGLMLSGVSLLILGVILWRPGLRRYLAWRGEKILDADGQLGQPAFAMNQAVSRKSDTLQNREGGGII
ncbi:MAG: hypothetical protein LBD30_09045 [Verrucomicrobiales bacterium]|jgi:hypothetical protein|nr:hypothetical protein [Verrucomicrobiales bacterium]